MSLTFMHYNFARKHESLGGRTPAMAAGIADHRWTADEIVTLLDDPTLTGPQEPEDYEPEAPEKKKSPTYAYRVFLPRKPEQIEGEWLPERPPGINHSN